LASTLDLWEFLAGVQHLAFASDFQLGLLVQRTDMANAFRSASFNSKLSCMRAPFR
jgi:hypothetical protein